jgi:hypothetical protein
MRSINTTQFDRSFASGLANSTMSSIGFDQDLDQFFSSLRQALRREQTAATAAGSAAARLWKKTRVGIAQIVLIEVSQRPSLGIRRVVRRVPIAPSFR